MEKERRLPNKNPGMFIFGLCLFLLVAGGTAWHYCANRPLRALKWRRSEDQLGHEVARYFDEDMINILLLGFDRTPPGTNIFVSTGWIRSCFLNLKTRKVNIVSIPDSHVGSPVWMDTIRSTVPIRLECRAEEINEWTEYCFGAGSGILGRCPFIICQGGYGYSGTLLKSWGR